LTGSSPERQQRLVKQPLAAEDEDPAENPDHRADHQRHDQQEQPHCLPSQFQTMIAEYNAGSASVEQLFEQLLDFIRRMSDEEQRAVREGLDEEELAIFDLLTRPEPKLTNAQEVEVKAIARRLLAKLKREKLILDWRLKENAKADVRQTIREEFDELPEV